LIYKAMGFPTDFFPVLFAIPRTAGWLAHWVEYLDDPENNILRPRQVYLGSGFRDYKSIEGRAAVGKADIVSDSSAEAKRRTASEVAP
jgi:citrate synthase